MSTSEKSHKGRIGKLSVCRAFGWVFNQSDFEQKEITVYIKNEPIHTTKALNHRADLLHLHPTGNCGFDINLMPFDIENIHEVKIKMGDFVIPKSPSCYSENINLKYFFLHIPKTAGTSLRKMLYEHFTQDEIFPSTNDIIQNGRRYPSVNSIKRNAQKIQSCKNLLLGHYPYQVVDFFSKRPSIIVFLRNPIRRYLSNIAHLQRHDPKYQNLSFDQIFDLNVLRIQNLQVRYLSGNLRDPISDKDLDLALKNLNACEFIGITERFNDSIKLLSAHTGLAFQKTIYANKGTKKSFDKGYIQTAQSRNELDLVLYEEATKLFDQRLKVSVA